MDEATKFFHCQNYKEAINKANQSIELSSSLKASNILTLSYFKLQDYNRSIEAGNKGLQLLETLPTEALKSNFRYKLMVNISKAYKSNNQLMEAKKILESLLETLKDNSQIEMVTSYIKKIEEMST